MKILFDVGANWGLNSLDFISKNLEYICFAFEPTPQLAQHLRDESYRKKIDKRYYVIEKAVADYNGYSAFNIAGQRDWGCSSLLEFSDNLEQTWPGRKDFKVTENIQVEVITLSKYIEEISPVLINTINYFHCDTQGMDLKVLKGMGRYIQLIEEGVIEVAANSKVQLYKNQHTKFDAVQFLEQNDFKITKEKRNDIYGNEFNLYFRRK
jgi:FkbM family methyltransferase